MLVYTHLLVQKEREGGGCVIYWQHRNKGRGDREKNQSWNEKNHNDYILSIAQMEFRWQIDRYL